MQANPAPSSKAAAEYVNTREAARLCAVSYSHFRQLLKKGLGPRSISLGRCTRFSVETLRLFMKAHEKPGFDTGCTKVMPGYDEFDALPEAKD